MIISAIAALLGILLASVGGSVIAGTLDETQTQTQTQTETESLDHGSGWQQGSHDGGVLSANSQGGYSDSEVLSSLTFISPMILLYAFFTALLLGAVGVIYPTTQAIHLNIAEALAHE